MIASLRGVRAIALLGTIAVLTGVCGCSAQGEKAAQPRRDPKLTVDPRLVTATNDLGFSLHRKLVAAADGKNVFISPTSIELALAMTYNGAAAETKDAMAKALGLDKMTLDDVNAANADLMKLLKDPDPKVELAIANSLWGREGVKFDEGFLKRNTDFYSAEVRGIDFNAPTSADTINQWVSDNTREKITKLVDADAIRDALLMLINALYFKGQWSTPFDNALTKDGPFTVTAGTTRTLPMMTLERKFDYMENDQFQAIALPYGDEYVRMLIFLPKAGVKLGEMTAAMTNAKVTEWTGQMSNQEGTITLPRFKADYDTSLKATLTALGMGVAFSDQADFSGVLPPSQQPTIDGKPFISDVIHKTVLEVNEEGTVAAAVTGVIVGTTAMPAEPFTMTVDHPFFLAIQDQPTGAILFMGSIVDPQ